MFISEEEAQRRIDTSENIVNRINRGDHLEVDKIILPHVVETDEDQETVETVPENIDPIVPGKFINHPAFEGLLERTKKRGLSIDEQASIGVTALLLGSHKAGPMFGVGQQHANSLSNARTHHGDGLAKTNPRADLQAKILERSGIVVDACFDKLLSTLSYLDENKLSKVQRAQELSTIARNLHAIIDKATPKDEVLEERNVHFHIWRPEMAQESEYETVTLETKAVSHDSAR